MRVDHIFAIRLTLSRNIMAISWSVHIDRLLYWFLIPLSMSTILDVVACALQASSTFDVTAILCNFRCDVTGTVIVLVV